MKKLLIPSIIALLLLAVGFAYFYFFFHGPGATLMAPTASSQPGFTPFGRPPIAASTSQPGAPSNSSATSTSFGTVANGGTIPALRLLSSTPVGGYGASTTGSTTIVRWIDRGRGNVIEAREDSLGLTTISNTVLPRIYESAWNKNLTSFVGGMLETDTGIPTFVYANIVKRP
ncbi:hypothetical protein KGP36_07005, partial [Patescibacteria group bacterium]|nr:hypothetical protein [Patescibacteria group bacterium]